MKKEIYWKEDSILEYSSIQQHKCDELNGLIQLIDISYTIPWSSLADMELKTHISITPQKSLNCE